MPGIGRNRLPDAPAASGGVCSRRPGIIAHTENVDFTGVFSGVTGFIQAIIREAARGSRCLSVVALRPLRSNSDSAWAISRDVRHWP